MDKKPAIQKSDAEWAKELDPLQHHVLRQHGTERPGSSPLNYEKRTGLFHCAGCGEVTGTLDEHATSRLVRHESPIPEMSTLYEDPSIYVNDAVVAREEFCPGCAVRLVAVVARPDDAPLADINLEA